MLKENWTAVSVGYATRALPEFQKFLVGKENVSYPIMDASIYGMHFVFYFKDPKDAVALKLQFRCMSNRES